MTCLKHTLPESNTVLAVLTLPPSLAMRALIGLGHDAAGATLGQDAFGPDATDIEYASWMPDPGAIEVGSWAAHMRNAAA